MSENIKFTVLIPTRERADTLCQCLRTVVAQKYENLSIIVSDNFSRDNTKEVVDSFADHRIRYINTGKRISMSHNWEFALNHVTDGWVTIIGDDDGLLPGALMRVADVIKDTGCQAVRSQVCYYTWPGTVGDSRLTVLMTSGVESRNARQWLGKVMRGDAAYTDLPCLYTGGFADIAVIRRARGANGDFFQSMIPDFYSAVAIASVVEEYAMLKEPVAVAGVSRHSTGTSYLKTGLNPAPAAKFVSEKNIPLHATLATTGEYARSVPIGVYESYLKSSHLHHDYLKVRLEDQLGLALSRAEPEHYAELRGYCSQVAAANMVGMRSIDKKARGMKLRRFFQKLKNVPKYLARHHTIPCGEYGVTDVYGAALLAHDTYNLEMRHRYRWLGSPFRAIKMAAKKYVR